MKELNEAKVLAVGPGGLDKEGKRIAPSVAPGDKVLIPQVGLGTSRRTGSKFCKWDNSNACLSSMEEAH